jgi:predicted nucleic acid-binding protein
MDQAAAPDEGRVRSFVLDTGALIALERGKRRMIEIAKTARIDGIPLFVPSICIAEWWRGRTDLREKILAAMYVVHDDALMRLAGEALAQVPKATTIDAVVMATAAWKKALVYTSDVEDLERLQRVFPTVRVLGV